jgi:hypothetical protein
MGCVRRKGVAMERNADAWCSPGLGSGYPIYEPRSPADVAWCSPGLGRRYTIYEPRRLRATRRPRARRGGTPAQLVKTA